MPSKKQRQRQLARNSLERRAQRQAERDKRAKQWTAAVIIAVLVIGIGIGGRLRLAGSRCLVFGLPHPGVQIDPSRPPTKRSARRVTASVAHRAPTETLSSDGAV